MDTLITLVGVTGFYVAIYFVSNELAKLITVDMKPLIDRKPLNCAPCLSFWITVLLGGLTAAVLMRHLPGNGLVTFYLLLMVSICLGLINFFSIKSKFKINE